MRFRLFSGTDSRFLIVLGLLVAFGLLFLSSASAPLAFERFHSSSYYLWHQVLAGVLPGLVVGLIVVRLPRRHIERAALPLFIVSIVLLLLVFIPGLGVRRNGTLSWLHLGPVTFQPAEFVKLSLILVLASWATIRRPAWMDLASWTRGFLPFLGVLGGIALLMVLQPDVGTLIIIASIAVVMLFAAGAPYAHLASLAAGGIAALTVLIAVAPYRLARLTVFLHPELDPRGIGYQINQALLAIGSGGLTGVGLGHSRQKFAFLPEVISDSIFAVIGEEMGFFLALAFLVLMAYVVYRVYKHAMDTNDAFARLVLVGIGTWWGVQAVVNIGAMVGLMPLTGLPLPFVSYGGTAMAVSLVAAGVVANVAQKRSR